MGLPTDGVELHDLTQTMDGLLGLATRRIPFGQGEMAYGITGMTLRKGVQEALPSRIVVQVPKGYLHIPEGQKQPFRPGLRQLIPDAEGLGQFSLPQQNAAEVDRRFSAIT